jgi:hypothetical protein
LAIPKNFHIPRHTSGFITRYRQIGDNLPATLAVYSIEPPLSCAVSDSTPLQQQARLPAPRIMQSGLTGEPAEHAIRNPVAMVLIADANSALHIHFLCRCNMNRSFPK